MNNFTTAHLPLRPVAEAARVLFDQITGRIKRDDQGPFYRVEGEEAPEVKVEPKKK